MFVPTGGDLAGNACLVGAEQCSPGTHQEDAYEGPPTSASGQRCVPADKLLRPFFLLKFWPVTSNLR